LKDFGRQKNELLKEYNDGDEQAKEFLFIFFNAKK
jgi:hypothetical protein